MFSKLVLIIKSMFTDKNWDADGAKIFGALTAIFGMVLSCLGYDNGFNYSVLGCGMIMGKAWRENE